MKLSGFSFRYSAFVFPIILIIELSLLSFLSAISSPDNIKWFTNSGFLLSISIAIEAPMPKTKLDADLYPIGAVVPLMEMYHYRDLVDAVMHSVKCLPDSKARHLMGAGHPMIFALCVAMGCDLFDSAAYILYAEADLCLRTIQIGSDYQIKR